jgi:hypothetical protein
MAKIAPPPSTSRVLIILFLLLSTAPKPSHSLSYLSYRTLFSLSQSLMTRVANLRASRGDISGSHRAKLIAQRLEGGLGLGFLGFTWSAGWDYLKNYAWRNVNYADLYGAVSDANKLLSSLGELTRLGSDAERAAWVGRNYQNFLGISNSLFQRLLEVFRQPVRFFLFYLVCVQFFWYGLVNFVKLFWYIGCTEGSGGDGAERGGGWRVAEGLL